MAWLTGYDGWSFYVHQCVLLAQDGDAGVVRPRPGRQRRERTTFLGDADIRGYPDHYVQSTERHPMDYLSDAVIAARGWDRLAIGVEMDNYYFSAACFASLQRHLPNARLVDATGLVNWQRAVKSEREITYIGRAAAHRRGDARAHPRAGRARAAEEPPDRRDLSYRHHRRRRLWRRLRGDRAAGAVGRRCLGART